MYITNKQDNKILPQMREILQDWCLFHLEGHTSPENI